MTAAACLVEIQRAAGRPLSDDEMADLLEELQRRQRRAARLDGLADAEAAALKAADDYAADLALAAKVEKRNALLNLRRRLEAVDFIRSRFAGDPALGVEALLVGVNRPATGARYSAAAQQNQLTGYYLGGFIADVEREGLWKPFVSGALDRDIARALWSLDDAGRFAGPQEALALAKIVRKWQEVARLDANKAGAWIKRMPGYIVRQGHDLTKIRRAGFEAWRADVLPRLDAARTFDGADPEAFLRAVYDGLASGVHLRAQASPTGFTGPRNLAKGLSAERVLHFRDADSWFDYNARFGTGNLREALLAGLQRSAQTTGLMRALGPNAEANLGRIMDDVMAGLDADGRRTFAAAERRLRDQLAELDGSTRIPVNATAAKVSAVIRAQQSMAKLGGAMLSSFSDIPVYGSEMRYQGRTMLTGMAEAIAGLVQGRGSRERKEILGALGVFSDTMRGTLGARFSGHDDLPGMASRLQQAFFKLNGLAWWTDTLRASAALSMSHRLALNRGLAWDALDPDLRRVLGLYGIDAGRWDTIRSSATKLADGRQYITPEGIADVDTADRLRAYIVDRTEYAVVEPDQRSLATMRRGTRPGSVEGELFRFFWQFKSFTVAMMQKPLGREVYGRGANSLAEAMRNGNGELLGLAQLLLWTTAFGYISMTAKDLAKGRTPRDPLDPKTFGAAMVQGGGMGIYGDFLFGEFNRFGGGLLSTFAGPTASTAEELADLYSRMKAGDDLAAQTFRTALGNTPFANLFYTRIALDYLFLYRVQESLNPGYLKRMERRIAEQNAQTFLVRPSEAAR